MRGSVNSGAARAPLFEGEELMDFSDLASLQKRVARLTASPSHSVFEMAPFGKRAKPHCLYFCYLTNIRKKSSGGYTFRTALYYHDNLGSDLRKSKVKKIARKLVLNAR